jgi:hypothetical protein
MSPEVIENLNEPMISNEIESVIKSLSTKKSQMASLLNLIKVWKKN